MIEIAFKIALSEMANISKSNILYIDEGISVFDEKTMDNINILFDFLKENYDKVILISHINKIKNEIDNEIKIIKNNKYSYINNLF
jgi:DNA repair exonuclease SbcCD ATPase subunit